VRVRVFVNVRMCSHGCVRARVCSHVDFTTGKIYIDGFEVNDLWGWGLGWMAGGIFYKPGRHLEGEVQVSSD
jgi:hypothetical protein